MKYLPLSDNAARQLIDSMFNINTSLRRKAKSAIQRPMAKSRIPIGVVKSKAEKNVVNSESLIVTGKRPGIGGAICGIAANSAFVSFPCRALKRK